MRKADKKIQKETSVLIQCLVDNVLLTHGCLYSTVSDILITANINAQAYTNTIGSCRKKMARLTTKFIGIIAILSFVWVSIVC